jgi:O-glycosyl hydrolase
MAIALSIFISGMVFGANITVNGNTTYQTIDGFGAHGSMNVWWSSGPFYNDAFLNLIVNDLGLTINRNEYYPPEDGTVFADKQTGWIQALQAKANANGEPMKFIATFWTPPGYMKDNGSTINGGHVIPSYYDDLGNYAVGAIQAYANIGINLYALSLQNEPAFAEPYNSCVYTRQEMVNMLKIAGPIINASYPNTKLFGAEHMLWALEWPDISFEGTVGGIMSDPQAEQWMDIWACHGYGNDGVTPDPGSTEAHQWDVARQNLNIDNTGKHFWMTETSGYTEEIGRAHV